MTSDLHLSGPTVTLFGDRDVLDEALSEELGRRGCSTHAVTIPTGWFSSVSHAVIRLDTPSGERALEDLASSDHPATHVVAVGETPADPATTARFDELCRQCSDHHDVSVIWHGPFDLGLDAAGAEVVPGELATTIADEIGHQAAWTSAPSYASQTYEPHRHRAQT